MKYYIVRFKTKYEAALCWGYWKSDKSPGDAHKDCVKDFTKRGYEVIAWNNKPVTNPRELKFYNVYPKGEPEAKPPLHKLKKNRRNDITVSGAKVAATEHADTLLGPS